VLGRRCRIESGAVIGSDGFGFAHSDSGWEKIPQIGSVRLGDDIEIGANSCIDRGAIEDTILGDGVKLDNLVHIAHNVQIGAHTAIAGLVGISGSTVLGAGCMVGGTAAIGGHLTIAAGTVITGRAMISRDIREAGSYSSGTPMAPTREWRRNAVRFRQLDDFARRLERCERYIDRRTNDPQDEQ